ncbi:tetratricopeptide repeat protein [Aeromonas sp. FDAARGOS 1415]|uniref:tetratricopeptide repeat protein n=1 Tax=Aeromonas TaxID=642 RepID=UPI001C2314DF|nr:tetratricopeptide repeat protein [Aeromonas sp. FDAARGOS 1415]QXB55640.1 tetratricopeptide repeat protein [Aeromonas sp. FDAARGOS 1415]
MTASLVSARYTYLHYLLIASVLGMFSSISNAATEQPTSRFTEERQEQVPNHLIGVMYTNQQMQLETVKAQQKLEFERLRDDLSKMDSRIDSFQESLNSQKQSLETGRQELATVSKRIDDSLIYAALSLDRFGLGITIGLAVVGFVGYFSFAEKTKREAKMVAKQWFDSQASELQKKIEILEAEFISAKDKISEHVNAFGLFAEESKAEIKRNGALVVSDTQEQHFDLSSVVQQRADFLRDIPISSYKYDDWNSLAYASYSSSKFEEAAFYWLKASEEKGVSDVEIAISLYNRGVAQGQLTQLEASVGSYDEVVDRFGDTLEPELEEFVAKALLNKGFLQAKLNKPDEALRTYEEVYRRFGDAIELVLKEQVASVLVNKGILQGQLNQLDAAIISYGEVVRRFGDAGEYALKEQVARALVNKGILQGQLNHSDAAVSSCDEVVRRFGDATELVLKEQVARALVNKGFLQGQLNQLDAAVGTYDDVVCRFGDATELVFKESVARALVNKGALQRQQNQLDTAMGTYENVVCRFGDAGELVLKEQVARALVNKGALQGQQNQLDAAVGTYDDVVRRFGDSPELVLKEAVARALVNKGALHGQQNQLDAAVVTYDEVVRRFGAAVELALKEQVARALLNKGILQEQRSQPDAAVITYGKVVHHFGDATELVLKEHVAKALIRRGAIESQRNQLDVVVDSYEELVRRFRMATELELRTAVAHAHNGIGFNLLCKGKRDITEHGIAEAEMKFKKALGHFDIALTYLDSNQYNGFILGNRAYSLALLGESKLAEEVFWTALCAPDSGGETLYEATLSDFDIYPIVQDTVMRELVERQWQLWLTKHESEH